MKRSNSARKIRAYEKREEYEKELSIGKILRYLKETGASGAPVVRAELVLLHDKDVAAQIADEVCGNAADEHIFDVA